MYRCQSCDTPAQSACNCLEQSMTDHAPQHDPWWDDTQQQRMNVASGEDVELEPA